MSTESIISIFLFSIGNQTRLSSTNIPRVWVPWSSTVACKIHLRSHYIATIRGMKVCSTWLHNCINPNYYTEMVTLCFVEFKQHFSSIATAIHIWSQLLMYWSPKYLSDSHGASIAFINRACGVSTAPKSFNRQFCNAIMIMTPGRITGERKVWMIKLNWETLF